MTRLLLSAAATAALVSACATPAPMPPPPPPPPPAYAPPAVSQATMDCVIRAGESDLFEIESSRIALQRSSNPDVRGFAQMMIDDHTRSTADMAGAVRSLGVNPPPPALGAGMAQRLDMLRSTTGPFDSIYMHEQVMAHEAAVALHESCAANAQPPVAGVSAALVPVIRGHLDHARGLRDAVQRGAGERG